MALTILDRPSTGGQLGSSFGTGLKALAQSKLDAMSQRQRQSQNKKGLESFLPGLKKEEYEAIAGIDPQLLGKIIPGLQKQQSERDFSKSFSSVQNDQSGAPITVGEKQKNLIQEAIDLGFQPPRNAKEATELSKIAHENRIATRKQEDAETLPYYEDLEREDRLATGSEKRLEKLKKLAIHGKLGGPLLNGLINAGKLGGYGLDFSFLKTKDAQEFEKESASFIKNAKDIFGNRITDNDLSAFMKTVPTLANTREGMLAIINNMEIANSASKIKKNAADKIIKENGGKRPKNLKSMVEEMTKKEIDELADKFEIGKSKSTLLGSETLGSIPRSLGLSY